jgi:hypothetical protein
MYSGDRRAGCGVKTTPTRDMTVPDYTGVGPAFWGSNT